MTHPCVLMGSTVFYFLEILNPKVSSRGKGGDESVCYEPLSLNNRAFWSHPWPGEEVRNRTGNPIRSLELSLACRGFVSQYDDINFSHKSQQYYMNDPWHLNVLA